MGMLEILVMRLVLWIGLPLLLVTLALGPRKVARRLKAAWSWLTRRRLDPEEILTHVVRQHEQHVAALCKLLAEEEAAEAGIVANMRQTRAIFRSSKTKLVRIRRGATTWCPGSAVQTESRTGGDGEL